MIGARERRADAGRLHRLSGGGEHAINDAARARCLLLLNDRPGRGDAVLHHAARDGVVHPSVQAKLSGNTSALAKAQPGTLTYARGAPARSPRW